MVTRRPLNGVSVNIRLVRIKYAFSDVRLSKPRLQGADSGRSAVRTQGCVESDCSNGSHKSLGKRECQISDTTHGLQGLLHSTRCIVAHVREPVPLDEVASTYPSAFVCNTRRLPTRKTLGRHIRGRDRQLLLDPCGQNPQHAEFTNFINDVVGVC